MICQDKRRRLGSQRTTNHGLWTIFCPLYPAQFRGPRARIRGILFPTRPNRLRRNAAIEAGAYSVAEGCLDQAVLAAVKTDYRRPAARPQGTRQYPQKLLKIGQFAIDEQAQRLKGSGGRVQVPEGRRGMEAPALFFLPDLAGSHNNPNQVSCP